MELNYYFINNVYFCELCNFKHANKHNFKYHLSCEKHKNYILLNEKVKKTIYGYKCKNCNKEYKLLRYIKNHICQTKIDFPDNLEPIIDAIKEPSVKNNEVITLLKEQNQELLQKIHDKDNKLEKQNQELLQIIKELSIQKSNNIHIENTNSNNKTLNYQNITNYLNDKCADALNVEDFIPMIEVSLSDMLKISNNNMKRKDAIKMILEDNLNKLDFDKQPFKCSDIKRKKIYARTGGEWINDEEYKQTKKVFRHINNKAAMKSEEPHTKEILEETDMSSYELRKPLSYGCTDFEIEKCIESEKRILSEVTYYKNEE